jgi:tRNA(fMet)-specific endonuclease VapC
MIVLDTSYLTFLEWNGSPAARLIYDELKRRRETLTTTIASYEEQMRGWMAYLAMAKTVAKQLEGYRLLKRNLQLFCAVQVLSFNEAAADIFQDLRRSNRRLGTMDLRIAAIVLAHDATLLTQNLKDFQQIPGLAVENWIKE